MINQNNVEQSNAGKRLAGVCSQEGSSSLMERERGATDMEGGSVPSFQLRQTKTSWQRWRWSNTAGGAFTVPPHRVTPKRGTLGPPNSTCCL